VEQHVAGHHRVLGAVEVLQDVRFLLRQPDLLVLLVEEDFAGGAEGVGSDAEDRVLRLFVLAQLGADPREEDGQLERLGDIVVGPGVEALAKINASLR